MFIGDSYSWVGIYEKHVRDIYESSTGKSIKLLGTNSNPRFPEYGAESNIFHEGYSGVSWNWFANYEDSPFVFDGTIDCSRYFLDSLDNEKPDLVVIFLGINDIGSGDPSSIETIDERIDLFFGVNRMTKVMNSLIQALPDVEIGIVLTPPTNEREYTYTNPDLLNYWERKLMHHRLCQRYIDHFKTLNNLNISIIPINVSIDTYFGFGEDDYLHPIIYGYEQIGTSIYSWIKYRISQWMDIPLELSIEYNGDSTTLLWQASSGAYQYHIYRSIDAYTGFVEIGSSSVPNYLDINISGSISYFYKVTADNRS